jgi:hypothetical protein
VSRTRGFGCAGEPALSGSRGEDLHPKPAEGRRLEVGRECGVLCDLVEERDAFVVVECALEERHETSIHGFTHFKISR